MFPSLDRDSLTALGVWLAWSAGGIVCDTTTKVILRRHRSPALLTAAQFIASWGVGSASNRLSNTLTRPRSSSSSSSSPPSSSLPSPATSRLFLLLVLCHSLGYLVTNVSIEYLPLSFMQTVKACAPLFTAALAWVWTGARYSGRVILSLLGITAGIVVSSAAELKLSLIGLVAGLLSNLLMAARDMLLKQAVAESRGQSHQEEIYASVSMYSFFVVFPLSLAFEGLGPLEGPIGCLMFDSDTCAAGLPVFVQLLPLYMLDGALHLLYNLLSCDFLVRVAVLTHAVANVGRRVFGIIVSLLIFHNVIQWNGIAGIVIVLVSGLAYSVLSSQEGHAQRAKPSPAATSSFGFAPYTSSATSASAAAAAVATSVRLAGSNVLGVEGHTVDIARRDQQEEDDAVDIPLTSLRRHSREI